MSAVKMTTCWGCSKTLEVSMAIEKGWKFNGVAWVCRECRDAMAKGMKPKTLE